MKSVLIEALLTCTDKLRTPGSDNAKADGNVDRIPESVAIVELMEEWNENGATTVQLTGPHSVRVPLPDSSPFVILAYHVFAVTFTTLRLKMPLLMPPPADLSNAGRLPAMTS